MTATGSEASRPWRPGSGVTTSATGTLARTREAGTIRSGTEGSIGVATSRSATTTPRPAVASSCQRRRASARSASSIVPPAVLRQDDVVASEIAGSVVTSKPSLCFEYQIENAELSRAAFCSASGSRVCSSDTRYR